MYLVMGLVVGGLLGQGLPGVSGTVAGLAVKPGVIKVEEVLKQGLAQRAGGFNVSVLAEARTGSVELLSLRSVKAGG